MKSVISKITLSMVLSFFFFELQAQATGSANNWLVYGLVGISILVVFYIIINVADNLLAIEAKQNGIDTRAVNMGLFPRLDEIFQAKKPAYLGNVGLTTLHKGHNIVLEGAAKPQVETAEGVTRYAVQPTNFKGIQPIPKLEVAIGDSVKAGDPLFYDKLMPEVKFVAPVSGEVIAINRGAKRAITEVIILADRQQDYRLLTPPNPATAASSELMNFLLDSGAWPLIRQRPYNVVATPGVSPRDIFISTFDTAPLAPDLNLVVQGHEADFQQGLDVLARLTTGSVYLGLDGRGDQAPPAVFAQAKNVQTHYFRGKHPAGNVGVQIHHLAPVGSLDQVWTLGVQDVVTIGKLFTEKRFNSQRTVALTGAELKTPRYVRTHLGAHLGELLAGQLTSDNVRIVSGDVLSGEQKSQEGFLNFHDDQVTVLEEGNYYEMFGWLVPQKARPSISRTYLNFLMPDREFQADTNTHGEKRAFVVTNDYEAVMPMDIYTQQLMKAIVVNDFEKMEGLGIYELVEEDIALCEFVCVSKQPLQHILREGLDTMRAQS